MLEAPDLPEEIIIAALEGNYPISVHDLSFLPIGYDSAAWVFRTTAADGTRYFLKVRKSITNEASLSVPYLLQKGGVKQIVAPMPTISGNLWAPMDGFALILYPYVDGKTAADAGLSKASWIEFGAMVRQIHNMELDTEQSKDIRREAYEPEWGPTVAEVDGYIQSHTFAEPARQELAHFWRARRDEILRMLDRTQFLGKKLQASEPPLCLCHADLHTWNVLTDSNLRLWLVDWDEVVLAPRERDLMFVVGGIVADLVKHVEEGYFFEGYGATATDPLGIAYYRHAWAIGDIGAFAETVLLKPDVGDLTREDALRGLTSLFEPGNIVSLAYAADTASLKRLTGGAERPD